MTNHLVDLSRARQATSEDLSGLQAHLAQLVGEPFRFARVSYGEELTLHLGDLRPARSPKLKELQYGAYILGVRASPWVLKAGAAPLVLSAGVDLGSPMSSVGKQVPKEDIEANPLIEPGSRVLTALAFVVKPVNAFGLQLRFSDGSALHILPYSPNAEGPEAADDDELPELADWELTSPNGLLSAGPHRIWAFKPSFRPG